MNDNLAQALNEQMNFEFYSAHVYLAMAAYCSSESLDGFANFFLVQAEEERFHAMKLYKYINDRRGRATLAALPEPKTATIPCWTYLSMATSMSSKTRKNFIIWLTWPSMDASMQRSIS